MLSYKFKHLCSRVIASLSAFGLISISNESGAKTLSGSFTDALPGDSFKYTRVGAMTMTANMQNVTATCTINGATAAGATVAKNISFDIMNSQGDMVSGCQVTCKDGYFLKGTQGQKSIVYSGSTTGEYAKDVIDTAASPFCVPVGSCSRGSSSTIKSVTPSMERNDITGKAGDGTAYVDYKAKCTWTCADGYSVGGGADTTSTFSGSSGYATGVITPDNACKARTFKVTFDCGAGATYGTTSNQSGTGQATYNSTFAIPDSASCYKMGYSFKGWNGSTN